MIKTPRLWQTQYWLPVPRIAYEWVDQPLWKAMAVSNIKWCWYCIISTLAQFNRFINSLFLSSKNSKLFLKHLQLDALNPVWETLSLTQREPPLLHFEKAVQASHRHLHSLFFHSHARKIFTGTKPTYTSIPLVLVTSSLAHPCSLKARGCVCVRELNWKYWPSISVFVSTINLLALYTLAQAAERGADKTKEMTARAGRACNVSASILQHPDPGAVGVAVWLRAAYTAYTACGASPWVHPSYPYIFVTIPALWDICRTRIGNSSTRAHTRRRVSWESSPTRIL